MIREIRVTWIRPDKWGDVIRVRLDQDLKIGGHTVPRGFVTDGNSVPFGFRWVFRPYGRMFVPAVVHDYLLRFSAIPREDVDRVYLELGKLEGVPTWTRYPMYYAVAAYTKFKKI